MKKISIGLLSLLMLLCVTGCEEASDTDTGSSNSGNSEQKEEYTVDKAFTFDDLEITVGSKIEFDVIDNEFDENNGKDVIKIPVTVKNLKDETHSLNLFYYSVFGPNGTEVDDSSSLFDDSLDYAGDLKTNASYTHYLYYLYDGDGTYTIEFDDMFDKISIDFEVKK